LNSPHLAPGLGEARDVWIFCLGVTGIAATIPAAWRLQRRFARTGLRAALGVVAVLVWIVLLGFLTLVIAANTQSGGFFFGSRTLVASMRAPSSGVTFYEYQWIHWDKFGERELALRRGPFEVVIDHRRDPKWELDVTSCGHRLELRPDADGSSGAWIDGELAVVEVHDSW